MIDEFLRRLAQCGGRKDRFAVQKWADERMTPLEVAALRERTGGTPELGKWLGRFDGMPKPRRFEPEPYQAAEIAPGLFLYSGPGRRTGKVMLLVFATGTHGLFIPTSLFLQHLPSERNDVLMLQDLGNMHFTRGALPYAGSLPKLLRDLGEDLDFASYENLYCCGLSMGGLPALHAAIFARARRGFAIGGRRPWHIRRLLEQPWRALPAFDPLCNCMEWPGVDLVAAYGADHAIDGEHADRVARSCPVRRLALPGIGSHNALYELAGAGLLQSFLDAMLDIPGGADEVSFLASLAGRTPRVGTQLSQ